MHRRRFGFLPYLLDRMVIQEKWKAAMHRRTPRRIAALPEDGVSARMPWQFLCHVRAGVSIFWGADKRTAGN